MRENHPLLLKWRALTPSAPIEEFAAASAGWQDLPAASRAGLASLLGRLLAVGVGGDGLAACALVVMRDGLGEQAGPPSLEPVRYLVCSSAARLLRLCDASARVRGPFPPELGRLGCRARDAGLAGPSDAGFSPERWEFWTERLYEIFKARDGKGSFEDDKRVCLFKMWSEEGIAWGCELRQHARRDELLSLVPGAEYFQVEKTTDVNPEAKNDSPQPT